MGVCVSLCGLKCEDLFFSCCWETSLFCCFTAYCEF